MAAPYHPGSWQLGPQMLLEEKPDPPSKACGSHGRRIRAGKGLGGGGAHVDPWLCWRGGCKIWRAQARTSQVLASANELSSLC